MRTETDMDFRRLTGKTNTGRKTKGRKLRQAPSRSLPTSLMTFRVYPSEAMILERNFGIRADCNGQVSRTIHSWRVLESSLLQKGHTSLANRLRQAISGGNTVEAAL